jgi:hypothetical protein
MQERMMRNPNAVHIDFYKFKGLIEKSPKAMPCNIDMMMERKEKFLVGEWKREGEQLSMGQWILLQKLARQPQFIVLVITGDTDQEAVVTNIERITKNGTFKQEGSSMDELKDFVTRWYEWADVEAT